MEAVLKRALILSLVAIAPAVLAAESLPTSGELDCDDIRLDSCEFFDPVSGLRLRLPRDWPMRRLRVSTETGPSAGVRQRYYENTEDAIVMWCHDIGRSDYAERLSLLSPESVPRNRQR